MIVVFLGDSITQKKLLLKGVWSFMIINEFKSLFWWFSQLRDYTFTVPDPVSRRKTSKEWRTGWDRKGRNLFIGRHRVIY